MSDVDEVIAEIVVLALAIASSPLPIIPVVLVLGGAHARTSGPAFVLGWLVGFTAIGWTLFLAAPELGDDGEPRREAWIKAVLGAGLLLAALWKLPRHRATDGPKELPRWMQSVGSVAPARAAVVGLALAANPKNLLLTVAAVAAILDADTSADAQRVVYACFVLVASLGVAVPVGLFFVLGDRAVTVLGAVQRWLERNSSLLTAAVLGAIGAKLVYDGIAVLA